MPFFKAGSKLVYYAHVPKCAGSSIEEYLRDRFGQIAFLDSAYLSQPEQLRWTKSSPQHVDVGSLKRLIPDGFFDEVFTIVRHPVARLVSAYHFQLEVEKLIAPGTQFAEWLRDLHAKRAEEPFVYDNHFRPMAEIAPESATVFYLEHGLEALVPWFDHVAGDTNGPRAIGTVNKRGDHGVARGEEVSPSASDLALIEELFAVDFDRFGYKIGVKEPAAAKPSLSPKAMAENEAAQKRMNSPMFKIAKKIRRKLQI